MYCNHLSNLPICSPTVFYVVTSSLWGFFLIIIQSHLVTYITIETRLTIDTLFISWPQTHVMCSCSKLFSQMLVFAFVGQKWSQWTVFFPTVILLQVIETYIWAYTKPHNISCYQLSWFIYRDLLLTLCQPGHTVCVTSYQSFKVVS